MPAKQNSPYQEYTEAWDDGYWSALRDERALLAQWLCMVEAPLADLPDDPYRSGRIDEIRGLIGRLDRRIEAEESRAGRRPVIVRGFGAEATKLYAVRSSPSSRRVEVENEAGTTTISMRQEDVYVWDAAIFDALVAAQEIGSREDLWQKATPFA